VNFENLAYLTLKEPKTNAAKEMTPSGVFVGLGARLANTQLDLEQGPLEATNRQLDLGIQGQGFFKVKIQDLVGNGIGYTRNGNFFVNNRGEVVLGMGDGYKLVPPFHIPTGATDISISTDGTVSVVNPGSVTKHNVGQIALTQFVNPQGLQLLAGSIYVETDTSGPPMTTSPGTQGAGTMLQGFLESSNVDLTHELTQLQLLVRWRNALLAALKSGQ
jgi:flagellar basal-body rod protein FlgG